MEAIKLCRLDTPIIFIEARINLSRFVVTGCAAKTSATVTFSSLILISLFAFCFNIWLNVVRSEERFSRNAETDVVWCLLLVKKKGPLIPVIRGVGKRECRIGAREGGVERDCAP